MDQQSINKYLSNNYKIQDLSNDILFDNNFIDHIIQYIDFYQPRYKTPIINRDDIVHIIKNVELFVNEQKIIKLIAYGEITYNELSKTLKNNLLIVFASGTFNVHQIKNNNKIFNDKFYVKSLIEKDIDAFLYTSTKLKNDDQFILECLVKQPILIKHLPNKYKENILYVNTALRNESYNKFPFLWEFISPELQCNISFIESCLNKNPDIFKFLSKEFQDNENLATIAIRQKSSLLEFASEKLQNNSKLVKIACNVSPDGFRFTSKKLRNNIKFVLPILKRFPKQISYCEDNVKTSTFVAKTICMQPHDDFHPCLLSFFNDNVKQDYDTCFNILIHNFHAIEYIDKSLQLNKKFITSYITHPNFKIDFFQKACSEIKNDEFTILNVLNIIKTENEYNILLRNLLYNLSLQKGSEVLLLKIIENSHYKELYQTEPLNTFHQIIKKDINSIYYKEIIDNTSDFYQYLVSFVLQQKLHEKLNHMEISYLQKMKI